MLECTKDLFCEKESVKMGIEEKRNTISFG